MILSSPVPLHCLLLNLEALDALHVAHSGVDCRVVHGLDGGFDSVHGALLPLCHLSLSGHAVAFCAWRQERGQRLTDTSCKMAGFILLFSHLVPLAERPCEFGLDLLSASSAASTVTRSSLFMALPASARRQFKVYFTLSTRVRHWHIFRFFCCSFHS